jgi:NTP pyrophosphatase (non-canonical NTP hydrolase)
MDQLEEIRKQQRQFVKERDWEKFHSPKNLSMALAVEAGELMEIFMWLSEKQIEVLPTKYPAFYQNAKEEMADVFLYLLRMADVMNIDLLAAVKEKALKNEQKYPIEKGLALARSLESLD